MQTFLPQLFKDVTFLKILCHRDVPVDSPEGQFIGTYLAANGSLLRLLFEWFYHATTEKERRALAQSNRIVDESTISEGFKPIALHIVNNAANGMFRLSPSVTMDNLHMLQRGLQTIVEHGGLASNLMLAKTANLFMSPVEPFWHAWQAIHMELPTVDD